MIFLMMPEIPLQLALPVKAIKITELENIINKIYK